MGEDAHRDRPRPKPTRRGADTNVDGRRRLGRFFVTDETDDGTAGEQSYPDHFPGLPPPERIFAPEPQPATPPPEVEASVPVPPRPRPRPAAPDRPRPR